MRAGRNSAASAHWLVDRLKPGLGVWTILIELGSTRPVVSTTATSTTRPWIPAALRRSGYGGGPESSSGRCSTTDSRYRSEEHTSELQSLAYLVCRLLLEKKKKKKRKYEMIV